MEIGGSGGPWPLLNLRSLHRIVIFAIENHFSLAKWPLLLSVASSASGCKEIFMAKIFVISVQFTKITKIFDYENLELYSKLAL